MFPSVLIMSTFSFLRKAVPPRDILTQDNRNHSNSTLPRPTTLTTPAYRECNKRKWISAIKDYEQDQRVKRITLENRECNKRKWMSAIEDYEQDQRVKRITVEKRFLK